MRKKAFMFCFLTVVCLFNLFESIGQPIPQEFTNYITISNGEFKDGNSVFKPLCINYVVDYACNISNQNRIYYIAPCSNYSENYVSHEQTELNDSIYHGGHFGYGSNGYSEMYVAKAKLEHDLKVIDSLGFNVVRIAPAIRWRNDTLKIPTGSYAKYFELTDTLIAKCTKYGLRVILVLEADTHALNNYDQYCVYLDSVSHHYSNNKTVMAYVVFAEPSYKWLRPHPNDKLMISNWSRKWYYIIKNNAPSQLVTYGLDGVENVFFWDPSALTYDFLSMHFYHNSSNPDSSKMAVACYLKWMHDNVDDVWVLGETGYSGTDDSCMADPKVGSETAQYQYADYTMQKSLDCGCKGYSWWQYQEVMWGSCLSECFGMIKHYKPENLKMVHSLFPSYSSRVPGFLCSRPDRYYNIPGYGHNNISGVVRDIYTNPIKGAVVKGWSNTYKTTYTTFTNSQGQYTIKTPPDTVIVYVRISYKGYTFDTVDLSAPAPNITTLTHINYNRWKKNWMNNNYPVSGDHPVIGSSDTVVVGNFLGDEAQELVVIHYSTGTAVLYRFRIDHWEQRWTGSFDDWQITSGDRFYAGDYNGDGYDELLCVRDSSNSLAKIYQYAPVPQLLNNCWQSVWTNAGNGKIGNWNYKPGDVILPGHFTNSTYSSLMCIRHNDDKKVALCQHLSSNSWVTTWTTQPTLGDTYIGSWILGEHDKYYVGDFTGNGIDELFCVQVTSGSSDEMTLLKYSRSWNTIWSNNGISDGVGIYPYRANLHVGNFDPDSADEILGVSTWATKFDLNSSNQWDWSWSTYDSGRLSDWTVNPNHRIFFMKVMTKVPDYLLVPRTQDNHYVFSAFSFDP